MKKIFMTILLMICISGIGLGQTTINVPADYTTIQAAIDAAADGDIINVAAGTYNENDIHINKGVTIQGAGKTLTTISTSGAYGFYIETDDIVIKDLKIDGAGNAIRSDIDFINLELTNIDFNLFTTRAIELQTGPTVTVTSNIKVDGCTFTADGDKTAIRMNSQKKVDGFEIANSIFNGGSLGFYQANDGNQGYIHNLNIHGCSFNNYSFAAVYMEEAQNILVENNLFDGNIRGFYIYKAYTVESVSNITIRHNDFLNVANRSIALAFYGTQAVDGVSIYENKMDGGDRLIYFATEPGVPGLETIHINRNSITNVSGDEFFAPGYEAGEDWVLDLSNNYWGTTDPTLITVEQGTDPVPLSFFDYTPMINSGIDTDGGSRGFIPDLSELTVHGLGGQLSTTGRIQEGINLVSGSTVNVAAGTYTENVTVNLGLEIRGANYGLAANDPTDPTLLNTARGTESLLNGTFTLLANNITIDGFAITGTSFAVQANADGVSNITLNNNNMYSNTGGRTVEYWRSATAQNWTLTNNRITDVQADNATAITLFNITGITISNNTILHTNSSYEGRRGMNIDGGQNVTIENNIIDMGLINPIQTPPNYPNFTAARYPLQISASDRSVSNFTISENQLGGSYDGIITLGNGDYDDINITNNTLDDVVYCIRFQAGTNSDPGTHSNIDISNNNLSASRSNVRLQDEDPYSNITVNHNNLSSTTGSDPLVSALDVNFAVSGETVDATYNWWGTTVESEIQALISGDVDYDPWLGKTESAAISDPGVDVPVGTSGVTMNFGTLPSGGGSVDVSLIPEAPADGPGGGLALYLDISSDMTNYTFNVTITVDVSGFSGFDASTIVMYYNSTTESWVAVSGGVYDAVEETYTFTTNHFTPFTFVNTPSTAYDVYLSTSTTAEAGLIYPNDAWDGTTGNDDWDFETPVEFTIVPEVGAEFGACTITLQWDNTMFSYDDAIATGGIFDGLTTFFVEQLGTMTQVTIDAALLGENHTVVADDYIAKLSLNLLKPGYGAIDFIAMDFRAFDGSGGQEGVYVVGNGAEVKSYLGDVTTNGDASTGDGAVDFDDLSLWSGSYWSGVTGFSGGMTNYKVKYDVGPTADNTVYTLPQADDQIQFEDLMIFSISYGLTANSVYPKVPAMPEEPIELKLGEGLLSGQYRIIPVELEGSISDVRGISLSFSGQVEEVQKGELLEKGETPTLLLNRQLEGIHNVDMSVVGYNAETINLSGTIAYIKVREGEKISIASADIRNSRNQKFNLKISGTSSAVPESFELSQNYPNPFNPTTMIKYQLPEDRQVVLKIYNALGQQVTELVNEVQKAGYYEVQLNGSDLSSGVYFYHITAGDFTSVKKMMLIK